MSVEDKNSEPETQISHFVRMREPFPAPQPQLVTYERISWLPGQIPRGDQLRIDVGRVNRLLNIGNIGLPIVVASQTDIPNNRGPSVGSISPNGEATMAKAASVSRMKRRSTLQFDDGRQSYVIRLDFPALKEAAEKKSGDSVDKFSAIYAQALNTELNHALRSLIRVNYNTLCTEFMPLEAQQEKHWLKSSFLLPFLFSVIFILENDPGWALALLGMGEINWVLNNLMNLRYAKDEQELLYGLMMLEQFKESPKNILFPQLLGRYLVLPILRYPKRQQRLVAGIDNSHKS